MTACFPFIFLNEKLSIMKVLKNLIPGTVPTLVGTARIGLAFFGPTIAITPIGMTVAVSTLVAGVAITTYKLIRSLIGNKFMSSTKNS